MPFLLDCDDLTQLSRSLSALAQFLQRFLLQDATSVFVYDPTLRIGQIRPGKYGPHGHERSEKEEDESLSVGSVVGRVYAIDDEESGDTSDFPGGSGYPVTRAAVTGREDLSRNNECQGIRA